MDAWLWSKLKYSSWETKMEGSQLTVPEICNNQESVACWTIDLRIQTCRGQHSENKKGKKVCCLAICSSLNDVLDNKKMGYNHHLCQLS